MSTRGFAAIGLHQPKTPANVGSALRAASVFDAVPVAVDLVEGARNLMDYTHPERAIYIFGPEDGTLGPEILSWCRDRIYVPTARCMNLAATVNVILYDRAAKRRN